MSTSDTVVVNRWRRYGNDRLYVTRADATKIGWWDLKTGEGHPETPEDLSALTAAVTSWTVGRKPAASAPPVPVAQVAPVAPPVPVAPPPPAAVEAPRPWIDLALNPAGAAAREQALAAREAAPVRSLFARMLGQHTEERAWRLGAEGEELVARELAKLVRKDPRWTVLHALPVGNRGADLDHVVIGPGGVFTVNAKHHRGARLWVGGDTFMVDGHRQPYIRNSRHEAERAGRLLSQACGVPVLAVGVIAAVNAEDLRVKGPSKDVHVLELKQLREWILRHGEIYSESTIRQIHDAARRSTTWTP